MTEADEGSLDFSLDLPYITEDLPGIGGWLRARADHFVVEEIPLYHASGEGGHLFVNLTREGMTTRDVQKQLAALFGISVEAVGFAGLKDKHALATQTFSITVGRVDSAFIERSKERISSNLPVTVNWAKLHVNKLKPGHLQGNKFSVVITGVNLPTDETLGRAEVIASRLRERGVPNFFGPQRFGGKNVRLGLDVIKGQRMKDRWLQRLMVSSYLGMLCNRYLALRVRLGLFDRILTGDIAKKYSTGGLFVVEDGSAEQPRYDAHEISFTAPMYGSKMQRAAGIGGELEEKILNEAGIVLEQLERLGIRGTRRLGRLLIDDLAVSPCREGLGVRFSLPKGAYATTILREFMKAE